MAEPFQYAVLRLVPRVERGERLNVGVVLFCRTLRFLEARTHLDRAKLAALDGDADVAAIERHLDGLRRVAAGEAGAGAVAELPPSERFSWLAAPSSTVIQPSEIHTGMTEDPAAMLERLFRELVL